MTKVVATVYLVVVLGSANQERPYAYSLLRDGKHPLKQHSSVVCNAYSSESMMIHDKPDTQHHIHS